MTKNLAGLAAGFTNVAQLPLLISLTVLGGRERNGDLVVYRNLSAIYNKSGGRPRLRAPEGARCTCLLEMELVNILPVDRRNTFPARSELRVPIEKRKHPSAFRKL